MGFALIYSNRVEIQSTSYNPRNPDCYVPPLIVNEDPSSTPLDLIYHTQAPSSRP
jgi:hypothetical protein